MNNKSLIITTICFVLCLAALYQHTLNAPFIFDSTSIVVNQNIQTLSPWWQPLLPYSDVINLPYRPIVNATFALNYALSEKQTFSYHFTNLLIHFLSAFTLFLILQITIVHTEKQKNSNLAALIISLLWLIHPIQTQSVTYTIQRAESLMGLFFLLTLYCCIQAFYQSHKRWPILAFLFALLGGGTKAVMVMIPFIVFLYDAVFLYPSFRQALRQRLRLYLLISIPWLIQLLISFHYLNHPSLLAEESQFKFIATRCDVLLHYLSLCLLPLEQCFDYRWPLVTSISDAALSIMIIFILLSSSFWLTLKRSWLGFCGLWFFIILLPTSGVIPLPDVAVEHQLYLPLAAVITSAYFILKHLLSITIRNQTSRHTLKVFILISIFIFLCFKTHKRNSLFADPVLIWSDTVLKSPHNERAHDALAKAYANKGQIEKAIFHYHQAITFKPHWFAPHYNLGRALLKNKQIDQSINALKQAYFIDDTHPETTLTLGGAYFLKKDYEKAQYYFEQTLKLNPQSVHAHKNLETVYKHLGDRKKSLHHKNIAHQLSLKN